jgi:Amt family ammonium transporter
VPGVAHVEAGDTAWVLVCTALVLFMTPGLALFYGGMVRSKNVLNILMQNIICIAVVSITWAAVGYSLAFGPDHLGGLLGNLRLAGLAHQAEAVPGLHLSIPPLAFSAFQMMFAVITTALISGATADRLKFGSFVVFAALWSVVVYAPIAHWVFSPYGWLAQLGVLDFAGGNVVEINCGAAGLALALVAGKRAGWPRETMHPHSLPLTMVGAGILWFGWFGFNAGSALAADGLAVQALVSTRLAGCGGLLAWVVIEKWRTGAATTLGAASGGVAGLVAITPAAGYVSPLAGLLIGACAGAACVYAVQLKYRLGFDDSLDVVGVHFVGGVVGTLLIGVLATRAVNVSIHHQGLAYGGGAWLLGRQALAVVVTAAFSFTASWLLAHAVRALMGLRVSEEEEHMGLDASIHAESAYDLGSVRSTGMIRA